MNYIQTIQNICKTNQVSVLIGKTAKGSSLLVEQYKKKCYARGMFVLEGDGLLICGKNDDLVKCKKYLILIFLKHLARKLFKEYSYDVIHNPSEPMLLRDFRLEMEYLDFIEDTKYPKFHITEIKDVLNSLNLNPRSDLLNGWWIREKFFSKLISPIEEEIENDFKKFFYYDH